MYIYNKNTGVALILNPQEALIYPFNFGSYQEIRMGGFFSVVGSGFNSGINLITQNINAPLNTFYIGFKDSGTYIPGQNITGTSFYFGMGPRNTDTQNFITTSILSFGSDGANGLGEFQSIDSTGQKLYYTANQQNGIYLTNPVPDTSFASFWGISFGVIGNTFSGMVLYDQSTFYTDVTTGNLSRLINTPTSYSNYVTGYFTTGNINSNNIFTIPNAVYIYFPFFYNYLRIHCLDVEKFN